MHASHPASNRPLPLSREAFEQAFHLIDGSDRLESIRLDQLPSQGYLCIDGANLQPNQTIPVDQLERLAFLPPASWSGQCSFRWSGHDGSSWRPQALASTIEIATIDGETLATFSGGSEPCIPSPEIVPVCQLLASPAERRFTFAHREAFASRWPEFANCDDFELSSLLAEYTPEWIRLDPNSGETTGQLPAGIDEAAFQVTAYLPDGEAKTLTLEIAAETSEPEADAMETSSLPAAPQPEFNYNARHHFPAALQAPGTRYLATLPDGTELPVWIRFDAANATFSGAPTEDDLGMVTVRLSAHGPSSSAEDYLAILANQSPTGPIATALTNKPAPKAAPQPKPFRYDVAADFSAELGGAVANFSVTPLNGSELPEWLSFDETAAAFHGLPTPADLGSHSFIVVAAAQGHHCNHIYTIEVEADENGPSATMRADSDTPASALAWTFLYDASSLFADADLGQLLVVSATLENGEALPSWIRCNALTSEISAQPSPVLPSALTLLLRASDGQRDAARRLHVSIEPSPNGEVLFAALPIPEQRSNIEYEEFKDEPETPSFDLEYCLPDLEAPEIAAPELTPLPDDESQLDLVLAAQNETPAPETPSFDLEYCLPDLEAPEIAAPELTPLPDDESQLDLVLAAQSETPAPETSSEPEPAFLLTLSFDGDDFMFSLPRESETTRYNFASSTASEIPPWLIFDKDSGEFYGAPPRETLEKLHLEIATYNGQPDKTFCIDFTIDFEEDLRSTIVTIRRIQLNLQESASGIESVETNAESIEPEAEVIEALISQATVAEEAIAATESPAQPKPIQSGTPWYRKLGYFRSGSASPSRLQQSKKIIPPALAKRHDPVARHK